MINIILIAVLILPWLIIPVEHIPEPTRLIKASFFDICMMGIIVMGIFDGMKFEYKNKYFAWLCAWVFITMGFNWYFPLCRGFGFNASTIESSIHFLLCAVTTVFVCSTIERPDFVKIAKAITFSITAVAAFGFLQIVGLDPMKNMAHYAWQEVRHVCALLDHPDLFGNYLALGIPFLLYFGKTKHYLCLVLVIFALFFSKSSISYLAAFTGAFIFLMLKFRSSKKWVIGLLISLVSVGAVFALNPSLNKLENGFTGRLTAWKIFVQRMDNPAFGQGLGIAKSLQVQVGQDLWMFAHNDYLEIYLSLGILGLFLLSLIIIDAIRKFNYKEDNQLGFAYMGSFIAFLVICIGSFPMEIAPLALGGMISWWAVQKV